MSSDVLRDLEKAISSTIANISKEGWKLRVVASYDVDALIAAGIIIRYLQQNNVRYEFLPLPTGVKFKSNDETPTFALDVDVHGPQYYISFTKGSNLGISKLGKNLVVSTPYYSALFIKVLENLMILTNDVRYYSLGATLSKLIPRIKVKHIDANVKNLLSELCDINLIKVVRGIKIFNYSVLDIANALKTSLDIFIPGYSGVDVDRDVKGLSEEDLIKDLINKLEATTQTKVLSNDLYGENYLITQEWLFKDAYEFTYALLSFLDLHGAYYLTASLIISNYTSYIKQLYRAVFKDIVSNIYKIIDSKEAISRVKQGVYKVRLGRLTPLTPISKVLKSLILPTNSLIVYELDDFLYVPLSEVTDVKLLVKDDYEVVGGLIKFKELR